MFVLYTTNSITQYTLILLNYIRKHVIVENEVHVRIKVIETFCEKMKLKTTVFHLRLKLISRSPMWLGVNIVAFHPGCPDSIPNIIG